MDHKNLDSTFLKAILYGMCAAIRDKDYFVFLSDIFTEMNKISYELMPEGKKSDPSYYLHKHFPSNVATLWNVVEALYEKELAPIKRPDVDEDKRKSVESLDMAKAVRTVVLNSSEDIKKICEGLISIFSTLSPQDTSSHVKTLNEMLETNCRVIASAYTAEEKELQKTNELSAINKRDDRISRIRSIFSYGKASGLDGDSDDMWDMISSKAALENIFFYAGSEPACLDAITDGMPAHGLTFILGFSSGGKTATMSSILSNHMMQYISLKADKGLDTSHLSPPRVWGFIGEDSASTYVNRCLINLVNRSKVRTMMDLSTDLLRHNIGAKDKLDNKRFKKVIIEDHVIGEKVNALRKKVLKNTHWVSAADMGKNGYNLEFILNYFESRMELKNEKPRIIILDYLQLLTLPRHLSTGNRSEDLSEIAKMLNAWGERHGICVLSAVQVASEASALAKDMKFLEENDVHNSKSMFFHAKCVLSILPYKMYRDDTYKTEPNPRPIYRMAVKILKLRDSERFQIFDGDGDFSIQTVLSTSKFMTDGEWATHKKMVINQKNYLNNPSLMEQKKPSGGNQSPHQSGASPSTPVDGSNPQAVSTGLTNLTLGKGGSL